MKTPHPTAAGERLVALDVLRGFALFGVLLVNLPFAALPMATAIQPAADVGGAELWAWIAVKGLAETKFVSLFSLLFGIGLVLQLGRAEARGADTGFYRRRLAILGAVGLAHGLLLWQGDILFPYAVAGGVLYLLRRKSPAALLKIAAPLLVIGVALSTGVALLEDPQAGQDPNQDAELVREVLSVFGVGTSDPDELTWGAVERRAWTEGPAALTVALRAVHYLLWLAISSIISFNWHVLGLFCLGAALMKLDLLGPDKQNLHGRLAIVGGAGGLALEAAALATWLKSGFAPGAAQALATALHECGSLVLASGYLGAVLWAVHRLGETERSAWMSPALAAVGRTALTSYLTQSLAFNVLFPYWGFGLWAQLGRAELIGLAALIFFGQIVFATLWLRRFTMGPCEWLWRWGTYGTRPPVLRTGR